MDRQAASKRRSIASSGVAFHPMRGSMRCCNSADTAAGGGAGVVIAQLATTIVAINDKTVR